MNVGIRTFCFRYGRCAPESKGKWLLLQQRGISESSGTSKAAALRSALQRRRTWARGRVGGGGREEVCAHADPPTRRLAMKTNRADSRNSVCSNKELIGKIVLLLARKVQMRRGGVFVFASLRSRLAGALCSTKKFLAAPSWVP